MHYTVQFEHNGETKIKDFHDCHDVGNAFLKCIKKYPGCKLLMATTGRRYPGGAQIWIDYHPPSAVAPEPLPEEKVTQMEMKLV